MLLDLKLPKIDGLEVLKQIKSDERLRTIPIVVQTSGTFGEEVAIEALKIGATDYVLKNSAIETRAGSAACAARSRGKS